MSALVLVLSGIAAFFASLVSAFVGGGAALILFPLLLLFVPGTYLSLLAATKMNATVLSLVSGKIHLSRQSFHFSLFVLLTVFGVLGTAVGTYFVQFYLRQDLFEWMLSATLLVTALILIFSPHVGEEGRTVRELTWFSGIVTAISVFSVNILNGVFGGTGLFMTLFLVFYFRYTFVHAVAYAVTSYFLVNALQTGYLYFVEQVDLLLTISIVFGALLGSFVGTHLQYLKGNLWVRRVAIAAMVLIGVRMIVL